jgi:hypothetical protein
MAFSNTGRTGGRFVSSLSTELGVVGRGMSRPLYAKYPGADPSSVSPKGESLGAQVDWE